MLIRWRLNLVGCLVPLIFSLAACTFARSAVDPAERPPIGPVTRIVPTATAETGDGEVTAVAPTATIILLPAVESPAGAARKLKWQTLTLRMADGRIADEETGSVWNIFGQAIAGELDGLSLASIVKVDHFWFSWAAFHPDTHIFQQP